MSRSTQMKFYIDEDVLLAFNDYRADLIKQHRETTKSALVNAALLFYLQHMRETGEPREQSDVLPTVEIEHVQFATPDQAQRARKEYSKEKGHA